MKAVKAVYGLHKQKVLESVSVVKRNQGTEFIQAGV